MSVTVSALIASAKSYANDENAADEGWIPDSTWLRWLNVEYSRLYRDLLRLSSTPPIFGTEDITAAGSASYTLTAAMAAIVDVAEVTGDTVRPLVAVQGTDGQYGRRLSAVTGPATEYFVYGNGQTHTVVLYPSPSSGTYRVRYVAAPAVLVTANPAAGEASSIDLLSPAIEDRLALGVARRALIKESTSNRSIDRLIEQADEDIAMTYLNRNVGAVVRNTDDLRRPTSLQDAQITSNPYRWWWL